MKGGICHEETPPLPEVEKISNDFTLFGRILAIMCDWRNSSYSSSKKRTCVSLSRPAHIHYLPPPSPVCGRFLRCSHLTSFSGLGRISRSKRCSVRFTKLKSTSARTATCAALTPVPMPSMGEGAHVNPSMSAHPHMRAFNMSFASSLSYFLAAASARVVSPESQELKLTSELKVFNQRQQ